MCNATKKDNTLTRQRMIGRAYGVCVCACVCGCVYGSTFVMLYGVSCCSVLLAHVMFGSSAFSFACGKSEK